MKVKELIKLLETLDQEKEIRYDSYEVDGGFSIEKITEGEAESIQYYCIE